MARLIRFGGFELDLGAYALRRGSRTIKIERLAMELLQLLISRQGELVSRAEIVEKLWGKGVFLDDEHGVNTAIRKIRQALRDSTRRPRFIQTVPGKGYRFIAPMRKVDAHDPQPERIMLAVLPFVNLSEDVSDEYFSDGLTEEVISYLGAVFSQHLGVIARTSSMAYKASKKSAKLIGQELHVDYLLESGVRRQGAQLRITAQLIRVADETHLWAHTYDRKAQDVLELQHELALAIGRQIGGTLAQTTTANDGLPSTRNAAAHDLYLRGRYFWNQLMPPNLRKAIECFQSAVERDPDYGLAYAGMADSYVYLPLISDVPPRDYWEKAKMAAERAVLVQPGISESNTSRGIVSFWMDWDWKQAEASLRRAVQLDASNTLAHRLLAHLLSQTGRHDEAIAQMEIGRRLDPFSPVMLAISAQYLFQARRYPEAVQRAKAALTLDDSLWVAHLMLAQPLERMGDYAVALRECETAFQMSGRNTHPLAVKGYILATTGRREVALDLVRLMQANSLESFVPAYNIALVHAGLGDDVACFDWLEKAVEQRNVHVVFLTMDPKWDQYRSDPRFEGLLKRAGIGRHSPSRSAADAQCLATQS
jgi:TolB-like protein/Flp pilus assembly protein TadD